MTDQTYTLTIAWHAKWWQKPWYWLRRKPTSSELTYTDVEFGPMEIRPDGSVFIPFAGSGFYPVRGEVVDFR